MLMAKKSALVRWSVRIAAVAALAGMLTPVSTAQARERAYERPFIVCAAGANYKVYVEFYDGKAKEGQLALVSPGECSKEIFVFDDWDNMKIVTVNSKGYRFIARTWAWDGVNWPSGLVAVGVEGQHYRNVSVTFHTILGGAW